MIAMSARHNSTGARTPGANTVARPRLDPEALGLPGRARDHRIVVAMSGGVDSSVAAALVADAGYDTVGITMQLYDHGAATARKGACCAGQDIGDARRVAQRIGVPHYVLNYEDRFRQSVIDRFADSYLAGETPIPCVTCNQTVKFSDMMQTARDLGASALVTGHYIRSETGPSGWRMFQARDASRDQSYFLFATTQAQLDFLRFPLGGLHKQETRALAQSYGLAIAEKPDSQDICFVPSGNYAGVIGKLRPGSLEPGDVAHVDGRVLARHEGIAHFTVGQRKGLGVATGEPLFVVEIDAVANRVVVGPREKLLTRRLDLRNVNWLGDRPLDEMAGTGLEVFVKVRSTQAPRAAVLTASGGQAFVELVEGEYGVAAGQACVFYADGSGAARVLGGGFIRRAVRGETA